MLNAKIDASKIKDKIFTSRQTRGIFGEFIYEMFAINKNYEIQAERMLEIDFIVNRKFKVDVKTTITNKTKYTGKRYRDDICYDLIVINNDTVNLYPDKNSPLCSYNGVCIGNLNKLICDWQTYKEHNNKVNNTINSNAKKYRQSIKEQIYSIMEMKSKKRCRVVIRGSVSVNRWDGSPDNLPGSENVLNKYASTIFVQMNTIDDSEIIESILYIKHSDINLNFMKPSNKRQYNKGIISVLDLDKYKKAYPDKSFSSLDAFINSCIAT